MVSSGGGGAALPNSPKPVRVLIDTNVVLDLLLGREPWATEAKPIWEAHDTARVEAHLSASVVTDIFYICRKQIGPDRARAAVGECLGRFVILMTDRALLESALHLVGPDFEDDVQIASAQVTGMRFIVTRDTRGFSHGPIPAISPAELVADLNLS